MAKCKYAMREHQVSNDNGFTWTSLEVIKGDLIEYGSADCPDSGSEVTKWVDLEGDYICEDNRKYKKQVMYISYDDGVTWYIYYPTMYRKGEYIGVDDSYCSNKFEGHYVEGCSTTTRTGTTPTTTRVDPLKIIKCDSDGSSALTSADTRYYTGCATSRRTYSYGSTTYTSTTTCCYNLTAATIGNCVTEIGARAFSGHTALSAITIPSGVTSIGSSAFYNCTSLTSITVNSVTPPTLGDNYVFYNTNNCPIYVPCDSLSAYRTAWSSYAGRLHRQPSCPEVGVKFYAVYRDSSEYSTECDGIGVLSSADTRANSLTILDMVSATIGNCVTSIGDNAFYNPNVVSGYRSVLSSVTIPSTVTSIGNNAFKLCSGLTSVSIPNNVTSIGEDAFYGSGVKSIILPSRLTSISYGTFRYCSGLTSVLIPNGVTSIGAWSFDECKSLSSVTIPSTVTSIGNGAFYGCSGLTSVSIDGGSIGDNAFQNCYGLTSLSINNGVTSIGEAAFAGCSGLTSVVIPNSVTSIGDSAFHHCKGLTNIVIPNGVTSIGTNALYGCSGLTSIVIPSSVTSIGSYTFQQCKGLTSFIINAETPPTLGSASFEATNNCPIYVPCNSVDAYRSASGWSTYKNRILPISSCTYNTKVSMYYVLDGGDVTLRVPCNSSNTLSSAETMAFYSTSSLTEANIGDCVTSIGNSAFRNYSGLTNVVIPNSVTSIDYYAFQRSGIKSLTINNVTSMGMYAFSYCTSLSSCTIGNGVTSIGHEAFIGCSSLKNVTFGSGLTSFGTASFSGCSSLRNIVIPNSVTSIGSEAFQRCSGLTSIDIPDSVTLISGEAFERCSGLTSVSIGSGVTSIGLNAFANCKNLGEVIVKSPTPPTLGTNVFTNTNNCPIYVPCGTLSAYTSDTYWSEYENRLQEMSPCDKQYAWNIVSGYSCSGLTKMSKEQLQVSSDGTTWENVVPEQTRPTLPIIEENSVDCAKFYAEYNNGEPNRIVECNTTILSQNDTGNGYPYTNNSAMTTAIIGDCVTSIDSMAFVYCSSLTNINIPNSVTSIGYAAFENCSSLTSINIPSGVTSIGNGAFSGCTSLSSMTIPSSVTSLGDHTFEYCSGLTSITIDATTPPSIGYYTFYNANNYPIYVPCDSIGLYKTSGNWGYYADRVFKNPECPYTSDKYYAKYGTSEEYRMECDGVPTLTSGNTTTSTYPLSSMTSVIIGDCVTSIDKSAFDGSIGWAYSSSLTSVTIPNSVTSIGQQAFYYCSSLTSIDIPSGVTEIGSSAFAECTSLTSVTIGSGVTSIGQYAFQNCSSLTSVTINATTPPTLTGNYVFGNTNNCPIYVPTDSVDAYKTANRWSTYADRIQAIP